LKTIAVIYKSKDGTTRRYAEWLAEDLGASLFEATTIKPNQLMDFDIVIYGGGLYAGGIIVHFNLAGSSKPIVA
jgi:flavodoxin